MSKHSLRVIASLALLALLATGSAWAQGRGKGRGAANQVWRDSNSGWWGNNGDWRGDRWIFGDSRRSPGWDRGRKTGWGNCDLPPGQAKKYGCGSRSWFFQRDRYRDRDWNRDRDWRRDGDWRRDRDRDYRRDYRPRR